MDKIKEALEIIKTEEEGGCELYGRYLTQVRELIEQGIAELEKKPTFSVKFDPPGTATGLPFTVFDL